MSPLLREFLVNVAIGTASITAPPATRTLLKIFDPRFQGCRNTVCRFSKVGVNQSAASRE